MSDFDILIGVDMSNAEQEIKKSIESIGSTYKMKIGLILDNKDEVVNQAKNIQALFSKLGKIDLDFGLKGEAKDIEFMKAKAVELSKVDLSNIGSEIADSLDIAKRKMKEVRDEYGNMMRVVSQEQNNVKRQTETTGNQFLNQRVTKRVGSGGEPITEGNPVSPIITKNFKALDTYVEASVNKLRSMDNVAKSSLSDVMNLIERLGTLHQKLDFKDGDSDSFNAFLQESKAIQNLIEDYDRLEMKAIEANKAREKQEREEKKIREDSIKAREDQAKEAIKWSEKLAEVERKNLAKSSTKRAFSKRVDDLVKGNFENSEALKKQLQEVSVWYSKIQNQEKDALQKMKFGDQFEKANNKVAKNIDPFFADEKDSKKLSKNLSEIQNAETVSQMNNALKKFNKTYDETLERQKRNIELYKEQVKYDQQHDEARIKEAQAKNKKESEELDNLNKERLAKIKEREEDKAKLEKQMGDLNEKSQNRASDKKKSEDRASELALAKEINKEIERVGLNQMKLVKSTESWTQELDKIKSGGYVNDSELAGVRETIKGLSSESESFERDLKRIDQLINRLNTLSVKRVDRQETRDITKVRNDAKIEKVREQGNVPSSLVDDVKSLNAMLDFSASKRDVALIEDEMRKLLKLNDDIVKAGKEESKIRKLIADHELSAIKSADKYRDMIDDVVKKTNEQIANDDRINKIKKETVVLQKEINALEEKGTSISDKEEETLNAKKQSLARLEQEQTQSIQRQNQMSQITESLTAQINTLKERGLQLSYDEQRAIQQQVNSLKQLAREQKDLDSGGNSRDKKEQSINDKFEKASYNALKGFSPNSSEAIQLNRMIEEIRKNVSGLGNKVGQEFNEATREIEQAIARVNTESRKMKDSAQAKRSSTFGELGNALKKVPVWASAMAVVYGAVEQVRQGFQSILDIDAAMINLQKVSEASAQQLEAFKSTASDMGRELGVVAKDVIDATTAFQKLGYTLEQSTMLGKNSIIYANVGDMDVQTASDNLTGVIQGFGIDVDAAGNNVRQVVDMFNEVSNNFAIDAAGIGESMKRNSAVMHEAGNTLAETVALSTAANGIIQNPTKVGNGLKTIAMRLRGVSEEGEVVKELGSDLQNTFDRINQQFGLMGEEALQIMEDDGQTFKSTYEIIEEVVSVWGKLSDLERANLVEKMGGKEQGNIVSAIIQNWDDAKDAAETAMNSSGSAAQEFDAYMDGFEYKIGQFKNAVENFWITLLDTDAMKGIIDFGTVLVDLLTKITDIMGGANIGTGLVGLFALLGNKKLRDSVFVVEALGDGFEGVAGKAGKFTKVLGNLLKFAGKLSLIGIAASVVFEMFSAFGQASRDRAAYLDEEINKTGKLLDSYKETFGKQDFSYSDFMDLQSKGVNRSTEEEQKYLQTIDQVKDTMPELIAYYDEKGRAVMKTTSQVEELIRVQKQALLQDRQEKLDITIDDTDFSTIEKQIKRIKDAEDNLTKSEGNQQMFSVAKEYLENEVKAIDESNYLDVVDTFKQKVFDAYNTIPEESRDAISYQSLQGVLSKTQDKDEALLMIKGLINQTEAMKTEWNKVIETTKGAISSESSELAKVIDESFSIIADSLNIDANSNQFLFLDDLKRNLIDNIGEFGPDIEKTVQNIPDYINDAFNQIKANGINLDEMMAPTVESFERVQSEIKEIRDEIAQVDPNNPMVEMYDRILQRHLETYNAMKNQPLNPFNFTSDVMNPFQALISEVSDLDSAYGSLKEGQELSLSSTLDLISKHPQLIKTMKVENGVLKITKDSVKELAREKEKEFKKDLAQKKLAAQQAIAKARASINANYAEMQSIISLMKTMNLANKINNNSAPFTAEAAKEQEPTMTSNSGFSNPLMDGYVDKVTKEQNDKAKALQDAVKAGRQNIANTEADIEAMEKIAKIQISDQLGQIGSIDKPEKEKKEKEDKTKELQDAIFVVDKYAKKMASLNRQIEIQQKLQSENSTWTEAYKKSVNQEIYLTNQKKKAIDAEIASLQKQIKAKKIQQTGLIQIESNPNEGKTARAVAAELQQQISEAEDRLKELGSESDSVASRVSELRMVQVQGMVDLYNNQRESMSDDIAYQEYAMTLYDSTTQAYRDHAKEKLKLLNQEQKFNKEELAYLIKERDTNKNLNNAQKNELNELIRAKKEAIYSMATNITDVETLIANSGLEKYLWQFADEAEKYADAISDIRDKMKYDLEDDADYGTRIDYLRQILSLNKGEQADIAKNIKYLEGQLALYGDNLEMVEKITEEIKSQKARQKEVANATKDTNLEIKQVYQSISDQYVNLYKEQLQLMQEADQKYYEEKTKAEQKAHDSRLKQIDKELKALQDAYDKQMKLIDRAESTRDHEQNADKLIKETDELRKQIDILSMDDSYEAKLKKSALAKELSDKELELSELEHDRQVELRKDNLEDDLDAEKEKLENRKEKYQDDLDNLVDSLEKEAKKKQEYWEAELNNEKKFAEMRKQVLAGNFDEMFKNIDTWSENVTNRMAELGQGVTDNFTYKIKEAIDAMKDLSTMKIGSYENSTTKNNTTNLDGNLKPTVDTPKNNELTEADKAKDQATKDKPIIEQMKQNSLEWHNSDDKRKQELLDENQKLGKSIGAVYKNGTWYQKDGKTKLYSFDTGGYTGDWAGNEGRLGVLHKKEIILNEKQTEHIMNATQAMAKINANVPAVGAVSTIPSPVQQTSTTEKTEHNEYNIEVNIKGNADKKVANTVADQIVNEMKRTKGGRF